METLFHDRNDAVLDLNDLKVFERVGTLRSFSAAARDLGLAKSSVSRSIARLEEALGARLIQRTTRDVALTPAGEGLLVRSTRALGELADALDYVGSLTQAPRGPLRISAGIPFGSKVLAEQLPAFMARYPDVDINLDLTSHLADLIAERVDVAIRVGSLGDSTNVAVRLGEMKRVLCASPAYIERRGLATTLDELAQHDLIEMPALDGRPRTWTFTRAGQSAEVALTPRLQVNDALTIDRLVANGAGIGIISNYICRPQIAAGAMVQLLPEWEPPPLPVSLVFPSKRELSPSVRAFVDFMKEANPRGLHWLNNEPPEPVV